MSGILFATHGGPSADGAGRVAALLAARRGTRALGAPPAAGVPFSSGAALSGGAGSIFLRASIALRFGLCT